MKIWFMFLNFFKLASEAVSNKTYMSASLLLPFFHQLLTETRQGKNQLHKNVKIFCEMVVHEYEIRKFVVTI